MNIPKKTNNNDQSYATYFIRSFRLYKDYSIMYVIH